VEAIAAMLNQPSPADYIIATGKSHTLCEFMETAFALVAKDWRDYVTIDDHLMRPTDIMRNKVDPSKAANCLGWKATKGMKQVIGMMLEAEIENLRKEGVG
jgi:GDPmannose 4,6-dehydratase